MKGRLFITFLLVFAVLFVTVAVSVSIAEAQSAKKQLDSIGNTGKVFDGSDGRRSGMDIKVTPSGNVPNVPAPTKVETSSGTAGGYNVGTSSGTASGTTGGQKPKTGTEKAK
jgi:hypothetical protein